jgi:hypothetical protein
MKYILVALAFFTVACSKEGLFTKQTDNHEFNVDLLFEHDGCRVYRFRDGGYNRYFTNCKGSTSWIERSGKTSKPRSVDGL